MKVQIRVTREKFGARVEAEVLGEEGDDTAKLLKVAQEVDTVSRELVKMPDESAPKSE